MSVITEHERDLINAQSDIFGDYFFQSRNVIDIRTNNQDIKINKKGRHGL